jgi:hypothetical protein
LRQVPLACNLLCDSSLLFLQLPCSSGRCFPQATSQTPHSCRFCHLNRTTGVAAQCLRPSATACGQPQLHISRSANVTMQLRASIDSSMLRSTQPRALFSSAPISCRQHVSRSSRGKVCRATPPEQQQQGSAGTSQPGGMQLNEGTVCRDIRRCQIWILASTAQQGCTTLPLQ